MFASSRTAWLILRLGLAIVFLWFGVDKFIHPQYWLDAWVPEMAQNLAGRIGMMPGDLIHLIGIFEVLVGLSLTTGFFLRAFSVAGAVFLFLVILSQGFNEIVVRDVGLIGGLIALVFRPERTYT